MCGHLLSSMPLAAKRNVPPFIVFSDKTLHEMARRLPTTLDEMRLINGVGDVKLSAYGRPFLTAICDFLASHPETASESAP